MLRSQRRLVAALLCVCCVVLPLYSVTAAWTQIQMITPSRTASGSFGKALARTPDGRFAVAGAESSLPTHGAVFILEQQADGTYLEVQVLLPPGAATRAFGASVAITPDALQIFIGAPISSTSTGEVHIFERASTSLLFPTSAKQVLTGTTDSRFGWSVAVTPDALHLVVGAPTASSNLGQVHVFSRATSSASFPITAPYILTGPPFYIIPGQFGQVVAISPDAMFLVICSPQYNTNGGEVYYYKRTSIINPFGTANLLVAGSPHTYTGQAISMTADTLNIFVAARKYVRVFSRATTSASFGTPSALFFDNESFGTSISITPDALHLAVGAPLVGSNGQVQVFSRASTGVAFPTTAQQLAATTTGSNFGTAVVIASDASVLLGSASASDHMFLFASPVIATQPTSTSVVAGTSATFSVSAPTATAYQWQVAEPMTMTFVNIMGATSASLTVPTSGSGAEEGRQYRVVVTAPSGPVTSSTATLTLTGGSAPPVMTQPVSLTVPVGQSATFSVTASNVLSYQWQVDTSTASLLTKRQVRAMTNIMGATSPSLTINPTTAPMNGNTYQVLLTNAFGVTTSSVVSLTLTAAASLAGDPHVRGLDGRAFDFEGAAGGVYNLLADSMVHINALLGVVPATRHLNLPGHWITDMGVVTRCIELAVSAGRPIDSVDASLVLSHRRQTAGSLECSSVQSNTDLQAAMSHDLRSSMEEMPSLAWTEIDPDTGDNVAVTLKREQLKHGMPASSFGLPSGSDRVVERLVLTIDQRLEVSMFLIEVGYSDVKHRWLVPLARRWLDLSVKVLDIGRKPRGILVRSESDDQHQSSGKRDTHDREGWQEQYRQANDNLFGELSQ